MHILRRLQDLHKFHPAQPFYMAFLDWEKVFDRIKHDKLFEAMENIGVHRELVDLTKALYNSDSHNDYLREEHQRLKRKLAELTSV